MFRSYVDQTLGYFDRPRLGVPNGPVDDPAAWRSADLVEFPHVPVVPVCFDGERVRTFMHLGYFRSADRHPDVAVDDRLAAALDAWEAVAARPDMHLDMALAPGDLQLCSNHTVAHARRGYVDDPTSPRDLLRLWVTL